MTATILKFPIQEVSHDRPIEPERIDQALMIMRAILPKSAYAALRVILEWTCVMGKPDEIFMVDDFINYAKLREHQVTWAIAYLKERGLIVVKEKTHFGDYLIAPNHMVIFNIVNKTRINPV